ncbi:MAG: hypothetical protein CMJ18_03065 [Phycisphaeraceae bacterium]|nr:hypothetical protein [Phycisphaeraceae bacterium]
MQMLSVSCALLMSLASAPLAAGEQSRPVIAVYGGTNPKTLDKAIEAGVDVLFPSVNWYARNQGLVNIVARAHEHGIKVYPSLAVAYDGYGDAHHDFARRNPRYWEKRHDGSPVNSGAAVNLSWGHPEVRAFKIARITELVDRAGCDGIFLDYAWYFGNDSGYCDLIVAEFRTRHGRDPFSIRADDPQWLAFRADYVTRFVAGLRSSLDELDRDLEIWLCVNPDAAECLRDNAQDWAKWVDRGLVDAVVPHTFEISPRNLLRSVAACEATLRGRVPQIPLLACWEGTTDTPQLLREATALTVQAGCAGVAYNQSTALHRLKLWSAVSDSAGAQAGDLMSKPVNLVANSGFERGLADWTIGRGIGMKVTDDKARGGNRSLEIQLISRAAVDQAVPPELIRGAGAVELWAWIDTSGMPKRSSVVLACELTYQDDRVARKEARFSGSPARAWRRIDHRFQISDIENLRRLMIQIGGRLGNGDYTDTGTLLVDDVGLHRK